jgi:predicted O-methyltransferase YrrM
MYNFSQDWFSHNDFEKYLPFNRNEELHFLEIGSFEGRSAIWFLENMLLNEKSTITCIDPWLDYSLNNNSFNSYNDLNAIHKDSISKDIFIDNINISEQKHKVIIHQGYSYDILPILITQKNKYDFIYIDGNHTAPFVLADAVMSWYLLKKDGILAFDDYLWVNPFFEGELLSPKIAIDTFTNIYKDYIFEINSNYQKIIKKIL